MTLGNCTTGVSEGEHSAYKKSVNGPRPNNDICESASKLIHFSTTKETRKARNMAHMLKSSSGKASDREKNAEGLTKFVNKKLLEEHKQSEKYLTYRLDTDTFLVKKDYVKYDDITTDDVEAAQSAADEYFEQLNSNIEEEKSRAGTKALKRKKENFLGGGVASTDQFKTLLCVQMRSVIPMFERTTVVTLSDIPGSTSKEKMLVCTRCFKKKGYACRHIYKLLKRFPELTDASVRWQESYAHHYGVDTEMSKKFQHYRDTLDMKGIPITDKELIQLNKVYPIGSKEAAEPYFLRSLGKLRLRGSKKSNHWKRSNVVFEGVDPNCFACDDDGEEENDTKVSKDSAPIELENDTVDCNLVIPAGTKPCAIKSVVKGSTSYQVPSEFGHDNVTVEDSYSIQSRNQFDSYQDFMPMYKEMAKYVDGIGENGQAIARQHFQSKQRLAY